MGSGGHLGRLPMTRRYLDWITWSLRYLEELAELQIRATSVTMDRICNLYKATFLDGGRGGTVVQLLCYKSESRWFDPSWCHWNFH